MAKKIAVLVVHGVVTQILDGYDLKNRYDMGKLLKRNFTKQLGKQVSENDLVIKYVEYRDILQKNQEELIKKLKNTQLARGLSGMLRPVMIDFGGDVIAYQPGNNNSDLYNRINERFDKALHELAEEAGEDAPLCIIAHSLGSVVASSRIYDLQKTDTHKTKPTKLERGETLSLFYTMGSPIAIWSLRHPHLGSPVSVPHTEIEKVYPNIKNGERNWTNYYSKMDIIGYPLGELNSNYKGALYDKEVRVGGLLTSWNPLSHLYYWTDNKTVEPISQELARVYEVVNQG